MTLHAIVAALGGDLYSGGFRASLPAPGHSVHDRSLSLWLTEGRVIIHGFGGIDWRTARDDLRARGFIDDAGRLMGGEHGGLSSPRPDRRVRVETARRLWGATVGLTHSDPAGLYLRRRAVIGGGAALNLGLHPAAPVSVYRQGGQTRPALISRISDADDRLTAVEVTYLDPNGRPARGLRLARKTVGRVPPGAAVRLSPAAEEMLVGEGVITTLSAMDRFGLAGWALMAANNLAAWRPPSLVRRVLIAADRGAVGETAAARLFRRLMRDGLEVRVSRPDPPFGDWNEAAVGIGRERRE
ncbi:MAG: toprim domain-containing protein [Brevundimonas sp.]|uniref:toprim domain-containing protein n=1 Tax=Brevundimonas sp. TaxID=1871086 RepID=UPI0024874D1D|nr:toprim domain-containing protein [Brevundimonas sp.]MDI1328229.1 toprim domain-containing protein [Brevundimonas sp.]